MATNMEASYHTEHEIKVLAKFRARLKKEKFIHNLASNYYLKSNRWFVIPGIIITGGSSVISFLGTSDIMGDNTKTAFNIGVGVLTASAAILQSISSSFGFETRTAAFSKAADEYDNLITKIEFELCNPNENFQEFCDNLENEILKIKNDCKFLPPQFCQEEFEKEMIRRKEFKEEYNDSHSLTSIVVNSNNATPDKNKDRKRMRLSLPYISINDIKKDENNTGAFQDAEEEETNKLIPKFSPKKGYQTIEEEDEPVNNYPSRGGNNNSPSKEDTTHIKKYIKFPKVTNSEI